MGSPQTSNEFHDLDDRESVVTARRPSPRSVRWQPAGLGLDERGSLDELFATDEHVAMSSARASMSTMPCPPAIDARHGVATMTAPAVRGLMASSKSRTPRTVLPAVRVLIALAGSAATLAAASDRTSWSTATPLMVTVLFSTTILIVIASVLVEDVRTAEKIRGRVERMATDWNGWTT